MVSKRHQFIVSCLARKMRERGYEVVAFDGNHTQIGTTRLKIPPQIARHRPDLIGVRHNMAEICIGEGKTQNDLHSQRTKEQLVDFAEMEGCELIIGVPMGAKQALFGLLSSLGLRGKENVSCLLVPEGLFPDEEI